MRKVPVAIVVSGLAVTGAANAALIASDSFLTTSTVTTGYYQSGTSLDNQKAINGTSGYYTGIDTANRVAGWRAGTGVVQASSAVKLTHPLVTASSSDSNNGSLYALGNGNARLQYRDLATDAPASSTYYFSLLLRQSTASWSTSGTVYAGLGVSRAAGLYNAAPTAGIDVGLVNGGLTMFYNNGSTWTSRSLSAALPAGTAYLVELGYNTGTSKLTANVYNSLGTLVNNPATDTVTASLNASALGGFQVYASSQFSNGNPAAVYFDELRFGTSVSDVLVPEPAAMASVALGGLALLHRRRRAR